MWLVHDKIMDKGLGYIFEVNRSKKEWAVKNCRRFIVLGLRSLHRRGMNSACRNSTGRGRLASRTELTMTYLMNMQGLFLS